MKEDQMTVTNLEFPTNEDEINFEPHPYQCGTLIYSNDAFFVTVGGKGCSCVDEAVVTITDNPPLDVLLLRAKRDGADSIFDVWVDKKFSTTEEALRYAKRWLVHNHRIINTLTELVVRRARADLTAGMDPARVQKNISSGVYDLDQGDMARLEDPDTGEILVPTVGSGKDNKIFDEITSIVELALTSMNQVKTLEATKEVIFDSGEDIPEGFAFPINPSTKWEA